MWYVVLVVFLFTARFLQAQAAPPPTTVKAGARPILPLAEEIALARSAAPTSISSGSRVMVLRDSGYVVGEQGTTEMTCVVNRSWKDSVEPHCYDPEGAATVMLIELRRNYLRHIGKSETEINAEIGAGLLSGKYRLPARPALSYMMSARQVLYGDDAKLAGKWRPHLMIYYPYLTTQALGFRERPEMSVGMVTDSGEPQSSLMIIMPRFAEPGATPSK
jgi:hypothetical protein